MEILVMWQMKANSAVKTKESDSKDAQWLVVAVRTLPELRAQCSNPEQLGLQGQKGNLPRGASKASEELGL